MKYIIFRTRCLSPNTLISTATKRYPQIKRPRQFCFGVIVISLKAHEISNWRSVSILVIQFWPTIRTIIHCNIVSQQTLKLTDENTKKKKRRDEGMKLANGNVECNYIICFSKQLYACNRIYKSPKNVRLHGLISICVCNLIFDFSLNSMCPISSRAYEVHCAT